MDVKAPFVTGARRVIVVTLMHPLVLFFTPQSSLVLVCTYFINGALPVAKDGANPTFINL